MRKLTVALAAVVTAALLCVVVPAKAESWNTEEAVLEVVWQGLHLLDWGTTLDIVSRPDEYHEINPILGDHPSRGKVNLYMGLGAVLHPLVTHVLPRDAEVFGLSFKPRRIWQGVTIMVSGACVANNFSIGLRLNF